MLDSSVETARQPNPLPLERNVYIPRPHFDSPMWPFSDPLFNHAEKAATKYLESRGVTGADLRQAVLHFLQGFEHGLNTFKARIQKTRIPWSMVDEILREGISQNPYFARTLHVAPVDDPNNPAVFGACVGYVVGLLKFQSRALLNYGSYPADCADFITALKDKPGIRELIREVVAEWATSLEAQRGGFSPKEERNYRRLVGAV